MQILVAADNKSKSTLLQSVQHNEDSFTGFINFLTICTLPSASHGVCVVYFVLFLKLSVNWL